MTGTAESGGAGTAPAGDGQGCLVGFVVAERDGSRLVLRARELRGEASLTEVAYRAGTRQDELGKIERGETEAIRFATLLRLCRAFGVTPGELFELDEPQEAADTTPFGQVLAAIRAGAVTTHDPTGARRRLQNGDVLQDPSVAVDVEARADPPVARGRRRVPRTAL